MTIPSLGSVGAELYDALAPLAYDDENHGYALAHVCEAIGRMWQQVADLAEDRDGRPGWATLLDVETCPGWALPWLAQIPGARITTGAPENLQRDEARRRSGQARGRPQTMIDAARATLTGTRTVRLIERAGGSAWQIVAITRTTETPDPAATLKALMAEKPGGDLLTHIVSDAPIIDEITVEIDDLGEAIDDLTLAGVT